MRSNTPVHVTQSASFRGEEGEEGEEGEDGEDGEFKEKGNPGLKPRCLCTTRQVTAHRPAQRAGRLRAF